MERKLTVHYNVPFDQVKEYENNATIHDKDGIDASLEEFGYAAVSITVDENWELIGGHGTRAALMRKGYTDIPLLAQITGLTPDQKKSLRLALNKIPRNAGYDIQKAQKDLLELVANGYKNVKVTGYNLAEIEAMTARAQSSAHDSMNVLERNMPKVDMSQPGVYTAPRLDPFARDDWAPEDPEDEAPEAYIPPYEQTGQEEDTSGVAYVVMVSHPTKASAEEWLESIGRSERFGPGKRIMNLVIVPDEIQEDELEEGSYGEE